MQPETAAEPIGMGTCGTYTASMPGEVLSPSQASTFLSCSAKWWFRDGLGLPDPASGGAVRGKAVHKTIEYALRAKIAAVVLEPGALKRAIALGQPGAPGTLPRSAPLQPPDRPGFCPR